jgi:Skp family chaperone for outer membrane proteins
MKVERTSWIKGVVLVGIGVAVGVAMPGAQPSSAKEVKKVEPVKIGYVNIPKVLRDYERATQEGAAITRRREAYIAKVNLERQTLKSLTDKYQETEDGQLRTAIQQQALATQTRIEEIDNEAKEKLTDLSNKTIASVYEQIREEIAGIAKERGLDVVEGLPAATRPEDEKSPEVAQRMLQTPALIPFYLNPELDFTGELIERLNKKYPPEKDEKAEK